MLFYLAENGTIHGYHNMDVYVSFEAHNMPFDFNDGRG
jgi:hypothetical protein